MSRWPVAGPSEYWLLASSPASKVKKNSNAHTVQQIHIRWQQYTQDNYNNTHGQTKNNYTQGNLKLATVNYFLLILYITDSSQDNIQLLKTSVNLYACYTDTFKTKCPIQHKWHFVPCHISHCQLKRFPTITDMKPDHCVSGKRFHIFRSISIQWITWIATNIVHGWYWLECL